MAARSILACLIALAFAGMIKTSVEASGETPPPSFFYTAAPSYEPLAWMRGAERFPSGSMIFIGDSQGRRKLIPAFAASADPAISFDGQRVLFSGKRGAHDPWQIWEVALDRGEPRQITAGAGDYVRPLYLPDDRIAYARKTTGQFVIEVMDLAGGKPLALTYGPANFLPADVLHDGRILFEAGYPLGSESLPELYTVYSDGSGVESYRCDHGRPHHGGKQLASGDVVFTSARGLARFTSARASAVVISPPTGEYVGDVAELSSGEWLLPWRRDRKTPFQLVLWDPGAATLHKLVAEPEENLVQPVALRARTTPNRHPSGLHDWPNANVLCLNAYTSKYEFAPGSIRSVRVYARGTTGQPSLLGTAPVESDGSFFLHVPAERALQIELVDASGKTLKREAGFFWMRRGEQRECVGCHAGPERSPENAVPMILLKSTTPADMTTGIAQNAAGGH
ncbi:MAG TPA: hypothetical protein VMG31_07540 [Verrucomicrobiae bacterium]|nr:hypothetical protein [Verrucomicrobiae bacterium]